MNYIPEIKVCVVRDGTVKADVKELDGPSAVAEIARQMIGDGEEREHMLCFCLGARGKIKSAQVISIGTLSASLVHPREVFRAAIVSGAASIVVCHNHPSGECIPSSEDRETTRRLVRSGELIGIPLLDHVILGANGSSYSFREHGMLA